MAEFNCDNCNFKSLILKVLLSHIYASHSQRLNFGTKCTVCGLYFTKYNSLYKHTKRHHKELYDGGDLCADRIQEKETYVTQENNNEIDDDHNESSIVSSDDEGGGDNILDESSHSEISDSDDMDTDYTTTSVSTEHSDISSNESSDSDEDENPPENFYEEGNQVGFVFCMFFNLTKIYTVFLEIS